MLPADVPNQPAIRVPADADVTVENAHRAIRATRLAVPTVSEPTPPVPMTAEQRALCDSGELSPAKVMEALARTRAAATHNGQQAKRAADSKTLRRPNT